MTPHFRITKWNKTSGAQSRKSWITPGIRLLLVSLWLMSTVLSCAYPGRKDALPEYTPGESEQRLRAALREWQGIPYRWGRADHKGIDCSGLVMRLYENAFNVQLPRTTQEQMGVGRPVPRGGLETGDLVFFALHKKAYHVGIFLSDGEFAHASTSQGVIISSLREPYWGNSFIMARRVNVSKQDVNK